MGNNPETPKKRKKRRMATGLAAAGTAAAAIGAYIVSQTAHESAVSADKQSKDVRAEVPKADEEPVKSRQAETLAHVVVTAPHVTDQTQEADSGPTDEEASESILQDVLRQIRERVKNYDEPLWIDYKEELERCRDDSDHRDPTRLKRLGELLEKQHVIHAYEWHSSERGGLHGNKILVLTCGLRNEFINILANPINGTVNVVFHEPTTMTIRGIEPGRAPDVVNDYMRAWIDYLNAMKKDDARAAEDFATSTKAIFGKYGWTPPSYE